MHCTTILLIKIVAESVPLIFEVHAVKNDTKVIADKTTLVFIDSGLFFNMKKLSIGATRVNGIFYEYELT